MVPLTVLYLLLTTLLAPVAMLVATLHPRLREGWLERVGGIVPEVEPGAIWLHAASLGEGKVVEALIPALRRGEPDAGLLRTCTSLAARGQRIGADQTAFLPMDAAPFVLAFLDRVRPRCLVLVEAELWPALLWGCRRRGVPVVLVAPREGRGMGRVRRIPGLHAWLTRGVRVVEADGDLKRAAPVAAPAFPWARDAIVAGSTRSGEEEILLDAVAAIAPRPMLILAPREPARFDEVAGLLLSRGERFVRRTAMGTSTAEVVLLDTIGELSGLYAHARAAFVGGTFAANVGGHSPAEAAAAGCPIVHGPFTHANPRAWADLETFAALAPEDLADALVSALAAPRRPAKQPAVDAVVAALPLSGAAPPERPLRPLLWPLVPLWRMALAMRRAGPQRPALPVVSVGALTAGGAGKTPVAAWFAERLRHRDPAVISRGYGRRKGEDVRTTGEASDLGDELVMLARRGIRVVSSPDRLAGIEAAAKTGARVAILDDGLQVREVVRDFEVVVIDARWPTGGGPIPVGTARVPLTWLARADVVWVNHGPTPEFVARYARHDAVIVRARYRPVAWLRRGERFALDALPTRPAAAFAAIARPEGFFRILRQQGISLARTWTFPDHHAFTWHDLQSIEAWLDDHVVLATEKDVARLPPDSAVYALLVEPEIVEGAEALDALLAARFP